MRESNSQDLAVLFCWQSECWEFLVQLSASTLLHTDSEWCRSLTVIKKLRKCVIVQMCTCVSRQKSPGVYYLLHELTEMGKEYPQSSTEENWKALPTCYLLWWPHLLSTIFAMDNLSIIYSFSHCIILSSQLSAISTHPFTKVYYKIFCWENWLHQLKSARIITVSMYKANNVLPLFSYTHVPETLNHKTENAFESTLTIDRTACSKCGYFLGISIEKNLWEKRECCTDWSSRHVAICGKTYSVASSDYSETWQPQATCDAQMAHAHTVSVMWTGSVRIAVHRDSPWNPTETSPEITWLRVSARFEGRIGHSDAILRLLFIP